MEAGQQIALRCGRRATLPDMIPNIRAVLRAVDAWRVGAARAHAGVAAAPPWLVRSASYVSYSPGSLSLLSALLTLLVVRVTWLRMVSRSGETEAGISVRPPSPVSPHAPSLPPQHQPQVHGAAPSCTPHIPNSRPCTPSPCTALLVAPAAAVAALHVLGSERRLQGEHVKGGEGGGGSQQRQSR